MSSKLVFQISLYGGGWKHLSPRAQWSDSDIKTHCDLAVHEWALCLHVPSFPSLPGLHLHAKPGLQTTTWHLISELSQCILTNFIAKSFLLFYLTVLSFQDNRVIFIVKMQWLLFENSMLRTAYSKGIHTIQKFKKLSSHYKNLMMRPYKMDINIVRNANCTFLRTIWILCTWKASRNCYSMMHFSEPVTKIYVLHYFSINPVTVASITVMNRSIIGLTIVNGCLWFDREGDYMCINHCGASVINYFIASPEMFNVSWSFISITI